MDLISIDSDEVVQLAQEALTGQSPRSTRTVRNLARSLRDRHPNTARELTKLLKVDPSRRSALAVETPLDVDSSVLSQFCFVAWRDTRPRRTFSMMESAVAVQISGLGFSLLTRM